MFQQRVKNFTINFNSSNERNTFSSGDLITGHISFELTKETKITAITMELRGRANVHWSSGGGGGGRRRRRQKRSYSAKLDFFHLKSAILQEHTGMQSLQPFICIHDRIANSSCWGVVTPFVFPLQLLVGRQHFRLARMFIHLQVSSHKGVYEHFPFRV